MRITESQLRKIIREEIRTVPNVSDVQKALNAKDSSLKLATDGKWGGRTEAAWDEFVANNYKPVGAQPSIAQIKDSWKANAGKLGYPGTPAGALAFINALSADSSGASAAPAAATGAAGASAGTVTPAAGASAGTATATAGASTGTPTPAAGAASELSDDAQDERYKAVKLLLELRKKEFDRMTDEQVRITKEIIRHLYRLLGSKNAQIQGLKKFSGYKPDKQKDLLITQVNKLFSET